MILSNGRVHAGCMHAGTLGGRLLTALVCLHCSFEIRVQLGQAEAGLFQLQFHTFSFWSNTQAVRARQRLRNDSGQVNDHTLAR